MNIRKNFLYLLGGLFAVLAIGALLFPFKNGSAADDKKQSKNKLNTSQLSKQQGPPNFDALASSPARSSDLQNTPKIEGGHLTQTEPRFDVPTFLWASDPGKAQTLSSQSLQRANDEESAARSHLGSFATRYRLNKSDIAAAKVAAIHDTGKGAIIVKFKQTVGGIEVFRDEVNVIMNRNLQLVALSGYLTGDNTSDTLQNFNLQPVDALEKAIQDLTGTSVDSSLLRPVENDLSGKNTETNSYQLFTAENNSLNDVILSDEPSRVKSVMFHLPDGYVPAYYVETSVMVPSDEILSLSGEPILKELGYSYVISAVDGQLLFRNNLSADQKKTARANIQPPSAVYTYRVWADPVTLIPFDTPAGNGVHPKDNALPDGAQYPFVAQNDVSLQNFPFSMNDPWLPVGATDTSGNNVDAFVNLTNPDGYGPIAAAPYDGTSSTGDFRALPTGANAFQHTSVADNNPATAEARQGSIQQLFYNLNFLHDWFYDAGFNEAAGNAQTSNFGRGGLQNDNIKAQAQDVSGRNNANMLTPADGSRPRMRMYLFDTNAPKYVDVLSPAAAAGKRGVGTGQFGAQVASVRDSSEHRFLI
jgi:large repetitive protein